MRTLAITLMAVAASCLLACSGKKTQSDNWTDSIAVNVMVINDGKAVTDRNYVGTIASEREVNLSFLLGGTLTQVAVKNGQHVREGQLLAQVDATTASSLHATALATLRQAEDAYRRLEAVHKEGGISDVKWIEMETNLEKARQAEISARKHVENCILKAPFSGIVSCDDHCVGEELRPAESFGRLLDMTKLRISFSVPEQEVSLISVGDVATAEIPALNLTLPLRICDKSLVANKLGHTYKIDAAITGGDTKNLLPDMVAKVHIDLQPMDGIVIPTHCVQTMPEGYVVWVLHNGATQRQIVHIGDFLRHGVMVDSGLQDGDTVVTAGMQKLYTGAKVKIEK